MTPPDPSSPPHLAPRAAPLLDLSDDMRIRAIRTERWVGFARARRVLEILQALREHPPSTARTPRGIACIGMPANIRCACRISVRNPVAGAWRRPSA